MSAVTITIDRLVLDGLPRAAEAILREELARLLSAPGAAERLAACRSTPSLALRLPAAATPSATARAAARAIATELLR